MYIDIKATIGMTREEVEEVIRKDGKDITLLNRKPTKKTKNILKCSAKPKMYPSVYVGRMPVMTRSSLCTLKENDKDECAYDPGGYFIVNGRERTLISQERILTNYLFCLNMQNTNIKVLYSLPSIIFLIFLYMYVCMPCMAYIRQSSS